MPEITNYDTEQLADETAPDLKSAIQQLAAYAGEDYPVSQSDLDYLSDLVVDGHPLGEKQLPGIETMIPLSTVKELVAASAGYVERFAVAEEIEGEVVESDEMTAALIRRLTVALEWYADLHNYDNVGAPIHTMPMVLDGLTPDEYRTKNGNAADDLGYRARRALDVDDTLTERPPRGFVAARAAAVIPDRGDAHND